jgi:hypothetical protein
VRTSPATGIPAPGDAERGCCGRVADGPSHGGAEQCLGTQHCLSCTLHAAVARTLCRLRPNGRYDAILINMHPGIEADG